MEHVSTFTFNSLTCFCKLDQSAQIRYFCENSMIAHAALVPNDTFTPWFASIQSILDFLENYEVILAKFLCSCSLKLSFSFFFVVLIFCKVEQIVLYQTQTDLSSSGSFIVLTDIIVWYFFFWKKYGFNISNSNRALCYYLTKISVFWFFFFV